MAGKEEVSGKYTWGGSGDHSDTVGRPARNGQNGSKKIAALVGVAPMNHDSGKNRGYRKTKGARTDVRSALYMATLVACRYNPLIKPLYEQYVNLLKHGKEKKMAIMACLRKFLVILNAMMRDQKPFRCSPMA